MPISETDRRRMKDSDNVRVVVRCRPINDKENATDCKPIVTVDEVRGSVEVKNPNSGINDPHKVFTFDTTFGEKCKQVDVYNEVARPIVDMVLEGYNGTIFAYGQTGTGKTFTMEGLRSLPELRGIIPNSFAHIFGAIAKAEGDVRFLVRVSYLEIYNEEVRDLLGKDQNMRHEVKERPDVGVYVKDLSTFVVNNADDMDHIMTLGNKNRIVGYTHMNEQSSRSHAIFTITVECSYKGVDGGDRVRAGKLQLVDLAVSVVFSGSLLLAFGHVGATNMNEHSSRSHAIFTVTIECCDLGPDHKQRVRVGKLHLVDLAGSERQSKTGSSGQRLKEATKINLSLSTLGNVISALVDGKSSHIPYRNSKLTRLLQDSLGGNSKTVMVANIGPADYNYDETISTLRYANRAKNIKNQARINEDPKDALLRKFQEEIEELRRQLEEGDAGSDLDEDSEEEVEDEDGRPVRRRKKSRSGSNLTREKMVEIQAEIEADREKLAFAKDMAEEEKKLVEEGLVEKETELARAQEVQQHLQHKLQAIEKKIIVGGENLLEKAEEQEKMLQDSAQELEERRKKSEALRRALEEKEQERLDIEERYTCLQDEVAGKTKKLKKVWTLLMQAKSEMADLQQEHQREMEGLLENVRQLSRELRLQMIMIDSFIPPEYLEMIEQYAHWSEDTGEWQLKCVAYTGNNMRKQTTQGDQQMRPTAEVAVLSNVYLSYATEGGEEAMRLMRNRSKKKKKEPTIESLIQ